MSSNLTPKIVKLLVLLLFSLSLPTTLFAQSSIPELIAKLGRGGSANWEVRRDAAKGLGEYGVLAKEAVPALIEKGLGDYISAEVREAAAWALGEIKDPSAVQALVNIFEDNEESVRDEARLALVKIGSPAIPALGERLITPVVDENMQFFASPQNIASSALAQIGVDSIPVLIGALRVEDRTAVTLAAWALGVIGPPAKATIPLLVSIVLSDTDYTNTYEWAQGSSTVALARIGLPGIRALIFEISPNITPNDCPNKFTAPDTNDQSRILAAWALGYGITSSGVDLAALAPEALRALEITRRDDSNIPELREMATWSLNLILQEQTAADANSDQQGEVSPPTETDTNSTQQSGASSETETSANTVQPSSASPEGTTGAQQKNNHLEPETGFLFSHVNHLERGLGCSDCHQKAKDGGFKLPDMALCSMCHEDLTDAPVGSENCSWCHENKSNAVTRTPKTMLRDVHGLVIDGVEVHATAIQDCANCHTNIMNSTESSDNNYPFYASCRECHIKAKAKK